MTDKREEWKEKEAYEWTDEDVINAWLSIKEFGDKLYRILNGTEDKEEGMDNKWLKQY